MLRPGGRGPGLRSPGTPGCEIVVTSAKPTRTRRAPRAWHMPCTIPRKMSALSTDRKRQPARPFRRPRALVAVLALLAGIASHHDARGEAAPLPWDLCATAVHQAERTHRLPRSMLGAIAKVESGRHHDARGEVFAWPWTVTAEGRGRYLPSKTAAIAEVEALQARGVRSIDVGCLQINLHYHPNAFETLEAAFDPAENARAAARLLVALRGAWGSWARAVGNYHSNTPTLSGPYRVKVYRTMYRDRRATAQRTVRALTGG